MRKTVLSLILALALCVSLGFLAFAEASEPGRSPDFEDNAADYQTVRSDGSHYTSKTFDRLYHVQVAEPTGNVYDYYISAARVSLYNEAEPQDSSVAFRWTYDIYVNNKYNSSRVLGTSLPIAVKPL